MGFAPVLIISHRCRDCKGTIRFFGRRVRKKGGKHNLLHAQGNVLVAGRGEAGKDFVSIDGQVCCGFHGDQLLLVCYGR